MIMYFYGCRVNADTFEAAQAAVIAQLATAGLEPADDPLPSSCRVQYGEGHLWECYCQVVKP